jgi:site-specific DNA-cytosine methylase
MGFLKQFNEKGENMKVLSLFDGLSGGRIALERAGIKVSRYYSSEIDKYAIQIANKNYPQDIPYRLGDVTEIDTSKLSKIDLLIGGSPCTNFSFAGKRNGMTTKDKIEILSLEHYLELKEANFVFEGQSYLFWEFVRILKEVKPKYFLLENVKMAEKWKNLISEVLGCEPIEINSSLVSAQSRKRLYWTNIPNVNQPNDKGIVLKDIIEKEVDDKYYMNKNFEIYFGKTIDKNSINKIGTIDIKGMDSIKRIYSIAGKSPTVDTCMGGHRQAKILMPCIMYNKGTEIKQLNTDKSVCILARDYKGCGNQGFTGVLENLNNNYRVRKLTPLEYERLQTLPDNYTQGVSNTQRYKMIGNGWTIDVIAHIFKNLVNNF